MQFLEAGIDHADLYYLDGSGLCCSMTVDRGVEYVTESIAARLWNCSENSRLVAQLFAMLAPFSTANALARQIPGAVRER